MKSFFNVIAATVLMVSIVACGSSEDKKKIAALESELAQAKSGAQGKTTPAEEKPEGPLPVITFETTNHDFGTIKEGEVVEYKYKFKNTGDAPLIIQNAQGSCGCTASDWTKEPVMPGEEGYVMAKFDSNGRPDLQTKSVTVVANTFPKQSTVRFRAMVTPK
jgi:hypothetical protein